MSRNMPQAILPRRFGLHDISPPDAPVERRTTFAACQHSIQTRRPFRMNMDVSFGQGGNVRRNGEISQGFRKHYHESYLTSFPGFGRNMLRPYNHTIS